LKRKAIFLLYRVLGALLSPAVLIYILIRGIRNRQYFPTLRERLGELPASWRKTAPGAIWLHGVSVGEVLGAVPLVEELRKRSPGTRIYLSTSTLAGRATAEKRLLGLANVSVGVDGVFYAPLDYVWAVRRVLRRLRPSVVVILETEIWPNLFREVNRLGCGLAIVSGRISDRALPRYRRFAQLFSVVLSLCDRIVVQSELMRERYLAAGAPEGIVEAGGNLKYDFTPGACGFTGDSALMGFLEASHKPLWIAASTSADDAIEEEEAVIAAQRQLADWRLIVAPRKPDRFDAVARRLASSGLKYIRRSELRNALLNNDAGASADVLLLDSMGELSGLFAYAQVVFMGGTLAARGGHNILEPAMFGKPVIAGPHLENFRDIEAHFERRNAILRIASGADLPGAVLRAAADRELGQRALEAAEMERGASRRIADVVMDLYNSRYPRDRPAQPAWMFLWGLAQIWRAGSALDRRRKLARRRKLPVPVVSVGNITAGGTGKTPVTIELLREFRRFRPGLLTRGHGRSTSTMVLLPTGHEPFPISLTGDEAQLYLRAARVPIGIAGERFDAGSRLIGAALVELLFLDDGFQHLQLERDFDLVLVDSLHPFGGGHLLPLGRLREPLGGLARAHAFIITRENEAVNVRAIEYTLRRYNAAAPIFRARTAPRYWVDDQGETVDAAGMAGLRSIAFCGLGNPETFWKTLDSLGAKSISRHAYGDHHRYTPAEIRRLARYARDAGSEVLLTTSKDAVNLCPEFATLISPLRLYWLEISIEIDRRGELTSLIAAHIGRATAHAHKSHR
jgi:3-deoxy-D-manno-octulosonic-acid transferase